MQAGKTQGSHSQKLIIILSGRFSFSKNKISNGARKKEINGVPFFEIGRDFVSGAQSSTNLENAIKSNLS